MPSKIIKDITLKTEPEYNLKLFKSPKVQTNHLPNSQMKRSSKRVASKNASIKLNLQIVDEFYKPRNNKKLVLCHQILIIINLRRNI